MIDNFKETFNVSHLWIDFQVENREAVKCFIEGLCEVISEENRCADLYLDRVTCVIEVKDYPQVDFHLIWVLEEVKPKHVQIDTLIKHYEMKGGQYDN